MARRNNNKVTSRPGLFGTTNHYDSRGKKIGESRPGLFGVTNHYDARGKKIGSSQKGAFGRSVHYDSKGHKAGTSYSSIFGTDHYDAKGRSAGHTNRSGFGTRQSSFCDNGNFTMVDRDDRRKQQNSQKLTYQAKQQQSPNRASKSTGRNKWSDLPAGTFFWRIFVLLVWWFSTAIAVLSVIFEFISIGYDRVVMAVCGALSILTFLHIRSWKKKGEKEKH